MKISTQILGDNHDAYMPFLPSLKFRLLVSQEKESKMSLERTLAAIDKVICIISIVIISIVIISYVIYTSINILDLQVQNLMEVGNKLRAKLLMATGGEEASPLEQEIRFFSLL